jgi:hypothetical protein
MQTQIVSELVIPRTKRFRLPTMPNQTIGMITPH